MTLVNFLFKITIFYVMAERGIKAARFLECEKKEGKEEGVVK